MDITNYVERSKDTFRKVFFDYMTRIYSVDSDKLEDYHFTALNENDLIDSLRYYIAENKITSKQSASTYVGSITSLFTELSSKFDIENNVFSNMKNFVHFQDTANGIIAKLNDTVNKDMVSYAVYSALETGINSYLKSVNVADIKDEVRLLCDAERDGVKRNVMKYYDYVSTVPCKLIMKYALKNLTLINLKINDIDLENNLIRVNGFQLPIDYDIAELLGNYLEIRKTVLDIYAVDTDALFVKYNGIPYNSRGEYTIFFSIMNKIVKMRAGETFAAYRIVDMYNGGVDIFTISKLTDFDVERCERLIGEQSLVSNDKLIDFLRQDKARSIHKKSDIKCPYCGQYYDKASNNWVLVQEKIDGPKYISCKYCKGNMNI